MADIRINDLPLEGSPTSSEFLAIDGSSTRKSTIQNVVNAGAPVASQALAEAGTDNNARMTSLSTKQAIDFNSVPLTRTVTAGTGLSGGGNLSSNISLSLSPSSQASLMLADTSVQPSRQVIAGTGLSGGGALSANVTLNLSPATQTSLGLANTAIQDGSNALVPNGGTSGQVLVKNSNTNRDTTWATVAAATAVSYTSQSLTAAQQQQARANISAALKGHIFGMSIANNATDAVNDIDISAGECASTETNPVLMILASSLTKRIDAVWAVGSGNGGLDTGTVSDNTYHIWVIQRSDTGVVDALFSLSATSPNMPSGYDRKRRIASIVRASGSIRPFKQYDDRFIYSSSKIADVVATNPGTSAVVRSLSVPSGIEVHALLTVTIGNGSTASITALITSLDEVDRAPTNIDYTHVSASPNLYTGVHTTIKTNTSGQIRTRYQFSGAGDQLVIVTQGYIDSRGRLQ